MRKGMWKGEGVAEGRRQCGKRCRRWKVKDTVEGDVEGGKYSGRQKPLWKRKGMWKALRKGMWKEESTAEGRSHCGRREAMRKGMILWW